ncbi:class I adenylate-forming enzyme family protein [Rhodococcus sp. T2V]|uniref:class I adenylate-forming enzyme family protein n=1 Tax=Rhodococcus sp. T2V TaxID=3034164 RepID=UPI0023E2C137|nr:class I adenylate-forming enzyme family protein [Rhodococcus sp. T2V]MDF3306635.1 class I adenylate-forming enzyme family protein [Rhodococcus sp. T2V]
MDSNILGPVSAWPVRQPDEPVVECGGEVLTRAELDAASNRVVNGLIAHDVNPGDRVTIVGRPSCNWAIVALAVIKAGAVLCPLNERNGQHEITQALTQLEPKLVVAADKFRAALDPAIEHLGAGQPVVDLDVFAQATAPVPDVPRVLEAEGDDPVAILSTSGSTGSPKGVVFTHNSLLSAFFEWCLQEPGFMRVRSLNVSSMAFGAGLLNGFLGPLVLGGSVVFLPEWDPKVALGIIRDRKISHLGATTIFYEQMAADPEFADADLSSLTVAFTGGNPVTVELIEAWSAKGIGLRQVYGLTESLSNASIPTVEMAINHPDSVGLGGVLNQFVLKNADEKDCAPDEPGEIWIRGPGLAGGYWRDEAQTRANFVDGWLRTGDVAVRDEAGRFRVVGRIKDVIISGGINIYAAELERVIMELENVLEVAVIGVADEEFGETPAVLLRASGALTAEDVVNHCRTRLARYKTPRYVEFLADPLPRTAGMKINKAPLRTTYADLPDRAHPVKVGELQDS